MPYVIRKVRNQPYYSVKNAETGKVHSSHTTKANAMKQVKLLMAVDHGYKKGGAKYDSDSGSDSESDDESNKANGRMRVGMGLTKKQTQDFITASYAKKKNAKEIDGYVLDRQLSSKQNKVYVNPEGKVVIANAGTSDLLDWTNNAYVPLGLYHTTKRYKDIEDIQKKAISKYGKENITNVGHSQSGEALRNLANRGLTNEAVAVNPFIINKPHEGVDVIRSSGDLVSLMTPYVKETIESKSWNPLVEHNQNILGRGKFLKNLGKELQHANPFETNAQRRARHKGGYTPRQFAKDFITISTLGLANQGKIGGKDFIHSTPSQINKQVSSDFKHLRRLMGKGKLTGGDFGKVLGQIFTGKKRKNL
jgi:hypothetical protein